MNIEKLKLRLAESYSIHWDMTPLSYHEGLLEPEKLTQVEWNKIVRERAGYYFYVDVWNLHAHLYVAYHDATGYGTAWVLEDAIDEKLLEEAVREAHGALNLGGWYPINETVKNELRKLLEGE